MRKQTHFLCAGGDGHPMTFLVWTLSETNVVREGAMSPHGIPQNVEVEKFPHYAFKKLKLRLES